MDTNIAINEREELFPETPGENEPITTTSDVTATVAALKSVELQRAEFDEQEKELLLTYRRWFGLKRDQCLRREEYLKTRLRGYLEFAQKDKLATPEGTVFYQKQQHVDYPDDEGTLIAWIKEDPERMDRFLVVSEGESINKTELSKAIRSGEIQAPGVALNETTELRVRR